MAAYLGMMGMELNPRTCAMATTEGVPGLQLHLCPQLENPWHWVPAADSVPYLGLQLQPDGEFSLQRKHRLRLAAVQHWCRNTLAPPKMVQDVILAILGGLTQYVAPFIVDDSDTARHLDHITVQVAKDRARYAFDASRDSLQDDRTLGLTRVPTRCQQAAVALVGTLVHHRSTSVRAEVTKMFWEIAGAQGICPEVHYPIPEFATLAGGDWVHRIPGALAALGVGLYNPIACPRAAHVQLQSPPGNIITLRTVKLRHRDTCRLTVPHTTPWHGHHGPHHTFPDNDNPWPTAVRECLNQCADEHLHYYRREQEPTNHPGWRDALVHLFHTTGTRDPRLRLVHPTRAKQDAHTGPRVTPDGLHLHVGGYRGQGGLSPPTRGAAYQPPAALRYILHDVLAESEHREPNADLAWPKPLRPRAHAPMPVWLVTTDDQCTRAAGQAQLQAEWVIVQVGAGQPRPRGLPRGTALLVATGVPQDPHMAVHMLEDQPEETGHLVVHQRGGPAWLKEHVTAPRSWASTIAGAEIRLHDHAAITPGNTWALSVDQLTPSHPDVRWHSADLNAGWLSPTSYYWIPEAAATPLPTRQGADPANTPPASLSPPTSSARGRWPSRARCPTGRGWPPPSPYNTAPTDHGSTRWTPKSSSTSCDTQIASGPWGSPRERRRWSTRCPYGVSGTACAREGDTPGTRSGTPQPPRTTVTPYCTRPTGRCPRTTSCRTPPRTLATPNSLLPVVTATSIYGPPRCGRSARLRSWCRRTMR